MPWTRLVLLELYYFAIIKSTPSISNNISNDKLTPQKQLNKCLFESCSKISRSLLNIKAPLTEIFSGNQRNITASKTEANLSIGKNSKICTPLPENTFSNSTRSLCSKIFKIDTQLSALM